MAVVYGRSTSKIKEFTDHSQSCTSCKAFDLKVKVFRQYSHLYFIPLFPFGDKTADIRCNQCLAPVLIESIKKEYAQTARTPVYLYSMLFLIGLFVAYIVYDIQQDKKNDLVFVANPKPKDVYLIKQEEKGSTSWYFLKVASVIGDTVMVFHNNLIYAGHTLKFNNDDYFVKSEQWYYTKKELKQLFEKGEINEVLRNYIDDDGFYRFK